MLNGWNDIARAYEYAQARHFRTSSELLAHFPEEYRLYLQDDGN